MESPQAIPAPMPSAAQPRELSRLAALLRYEILDTPEESAFDDFTALAAQMCDTPIALISLVDDRRQWFKSRVGLDVSETPRDISFCTYTITGEQIFEVPDALQDPRFRDNPLVQGDPHIRFYAGTPLTSPDGHNLGTLCVIDRKPRRLSSEQRETLERLGRQVIRLFEQHLLAHRHAEQAALQQAILDSASSAVLITRPDGIVTSVNPTAERLLAKFGQRGAIRVRGERSDWDDTPAAVTDHPCTLAEMEYETSEIDGTLILANDSRYLVSAIGLTVAPSADAQIVVQGQAMEIVRAKPLAPAAVVVMWTVQARR